MNLIRNELYKTFHIKSTWLTIIIMLLFVTLVTFLYKKDYSNSNNRDYLKQAIVELENNYPEYLSLKEEGVFSSEEQERFSKINEIILRNEFILDNRIDVEKTNNLKTIIQNFFDEYLLLIIIFVILVSGSIVSDEYQKGTIKTLLTCPCSRKRILLAKFCSSLIIIPIITLILFIYQLVIGGFVFGYSSMDIPILIYNYSYNQLEVINCIRYFLIVLGGYMPLLIMIVALSFMLSTLSCNTGLSITVSFLFLMLSNGINDLVVNNNIRWLRYILTLNWDMSNYLFGGKALYKYLSIRENIIFYLLYLLIFLVTSFFVFNKRDIKNN